MQVKISEIENKNNIIDIRTSSEFNEFNIGGRNNGRVNERVKTDPSLYRDFHSKYRGNRNTDGMGTEKQK